MHLLEQFILIAQTACFVIATAFRLFVQARHILKGLYVTWSKKETCKQRQLRFVRKAKKEAKKVYIIRTNKVKPDKE